MTDDEKKHREFWINKNTSSPFETMVCFDNEFHYDDLCPSKHKVHAIEYAALKEAHDEIATLKHDWTLMREALKVCATRKECKSYECCASCGPIYEAEEALAQLKHKKETHD